MSVSQFFLKKIQLTLHFLRWHLLIQPNKIVKNINVSLDKQLVLLYNVNRN